MRQQCKQLRAEVAAGRLNENEIPNRIQIEGREASAVRSQLRRMRLWRPRFSKRRWTTALSDKLITQVRNGVSIPEILKQRAFRGRSTWSIRNQLTLLTSQGVMGIVDRRASVQFRSGRQLRSTTSTELEPALRKFGRTRLPDWFRFKFGISEKALGTAARKLNIPTGDTMALEMPCAQTWRRLHRVFDLRLSGFLEAVFVRFKISARI